MWTKERRERERERERERDREREREKERERVSSLKPYLMSIVIHCLSSKVPGRKSNV